MLCDVVRLARAGKAEPGKPSPCAKWKLLEHLAPGEADILGRKNRVRSVMVQYCDASLTPDNVLILAFDGCAVAVLDGCAVAAKSARR